MATLSLRLPESIHRKLTELAEREGVSLNQLLSSAAAEKLAALTTEEYLAERAKHASRRKFDAALAKVPKARPVPGDELPVGYAKRSARKAG
ncbi:MAG: toxin-antitoxin system HicB family antitoxin [Polyangiaceae bacterium]|jgi:predicted transcriptional regulator|nr:toxin-antitoxin system HicB family antitoxin [Polyangiaceae bacterium]